MNGFALLPKKHPERRKPQHFGQIRSFRNLFENSFDLKYLYNPYSDGVASEACASVKLIKFNGHNIERFRDFEQSVLMKIINNDCLDFDGKFLALLSTVSDSPLALVQVYTEELTLFNFVLAIEALYYAYGEPTKFRDALLRQLINEDPIDMKNPESFLKINSLITRVFRAFGNDASNEVLSMSCLMESIKMTPGTAANFNAWLDASMREKNLKVLQQWLEWKYQRSVSDNLLQKSAQEFRNVKIPPIMINVVDTNNDKLLKNRCRLCFGKIHNLEGCHIYMSMNSNQRMIALTIHGGCFLCTRTVCAVHIESNYNFCDRKDCGRPCEICQSSEHHFSICNASDEPFKAVLKQ